MAADEVKVYDWDDEIEDDGNYRVVQGKIQDQLHVPLMAQGDQFLQVLFCAEGGINLIVIRHVIFMIGRGTENRRQPDTLYPQAFPGLRIPVVQVIHPVDHAPDIADTIPVGIRERSDKDLIKNPIVIFHIQTLFLRGGSTGQQCQHQHQDDKSFHSYSLLSAAFSCIMNQSRPVVKERKRCYIAVNQRKKGCTAYMEWFSTAEELSLWQKREKRRYFSFHREIKIEKRADLWFALLFFFVYLHVEKFQITNLNIISYEENSTIHCSISDVSISICTDKSHILK